MLALASSLPLLGHASAALPPNASPAGRATTVPASGTTSFQLKVPAGAACPGDSATDGYRWQTFVVASSVDVSQLQYAGGLPSAPGGAQVDLLYSSGNPFVDQNTVQGTGAIIGLPNSFEFTVYPAGHLSAGAHRLGVACTLDGAVERFWSTTVLLTLDGAGNVNGFTPFNEPLAPSLATPMQLGVSGTVSGTIVPVTAVPAVQSYTVMATPSSGVPRSVVVVPPATSFTISGLSNRVTQMVTVSATNAAGTSTPSAGVAAVPFVANPAPVQVAAGANHSCARGTDGSVRCWGANSNGQLGVGSLVSSSVPLVVGGVSAATQVVAGDRFTCAVAAAKVKCWGLNASGQLGDGTRTSRAVPTSVSSTATTALTGVAKVALGAAFACAVVNPGASGTVRCWGANESGQLGDGTSLPRLRPVTVNARAGVPLKGVSAVAAGGASACALMTTGAVRCWGRNAAGQLGNNSSLASRAPVQVVGIDGIAAKATSVAMGADFACARVTNGTVRCWGNNAAGQLGNNAVASSRVPVTVKMTATSSLVGVASVSLGAAHACAVRGTGTAARVWCWGANTNGQLGVGSTTSRRMATLVGGSLLAGVQSVSLGGAHSLAIVPSTVRTPSDAAAWGRNVDAQLGVAGGQRTTPVLTASL